MRKTANIINENMSRDVLARLFFYAISFLHLM